MLTETEKVLERIDKSPLFTVFIVIVMLGGLALVIYGACVQKWMVVAYGIAAIFIMGMILFSKWRERR